jgi:uncharacterized protein (TIRG00374 family)
MNAPSEKAPQTIFRVARTGLSLVAGLAVAAVASWLLGVRPSEVLARVRAVPPLAIVACVGSSYVVLALQTLRWHQVMRPLLGLPYGQALCAQAVGVMLNAVLPARAGDLLRAQYLGQLTGRSRAAILGTEVVDRWLDWWGWVPVVAVLALTSDLPPWMAVAVSIFGAALLAWAAAMVLFCARRPVAIRPSRFALAAASFRSGLDAFASRRTLVLALVVAPIPWVWEAGVLAIVARGFDVHLTFPMAFCVLVGFNTATVIPAPGGLGAVETGGAAVLVLFGVDHAAALAFLFVYHLTQLLPTIALGATMLALTSRSALMRLGAPVRKAGRRPIVR